MCIRDRTGALIGALEAFGDSVAFVDENWDCAMGRRDDGVWATAPNQKSERVNGECAVRVQRRHLLGTVVAVARERRDMMEADWSDDSDGGEGMLKIYLPRMSALNSC